MIGSGRGYHKDLPLLLDTAEVLQRAGFTALRFDWGYFTAKGAPSKELAPELEDLDAAIAFARRQPGIRKLYLAGKSLGSIAASLRAQRSPEDLDGLVLLTLPIHGPDKPDAVFDEMKALRPWNKPLMIVCGDADPFSELSTLYRFAGSFEHAPRLIIVPGDHSLRGKDEDETRTRENVAMAARSVALWATRWAQGAD